MNCLLCPFKGNQISHSGDLSSDFVVVCESPSAVELAKNKLFCEQKGDLFRSILKDFKEYIPNDFLLVSAIACLPKQKDPKKLAAACKACNPRLNDILKISPRKIIISLGNGALHSLTGNYALKITKVRGTVFDSKHAEKGVLATYNPSHILRGGGNMQQFRRDLEYAVSLYTTLDTSKTLRAPQKQFQQGTYKIVTNEIDLQRLITMIRNADENTFIGYDIETDGFNPRKTEEDINEPYFYNKAILCLGISFGANKTAVVPSEFIRDELFQTAAKQCWHNGKYDISWLWYLGFRSARVDHDSMLMSYTLNERGGIHDLEQVGHDWLSAPNYKNMLEEYLPSKKHSYATIPTDILYQYQAIDTQLTVELCKRLYEEISKDKHLMKAYHNVIIPASYFLARVEENGIYIAQEVVDENLRLLEEEMKNAEAEFLQQAHECGEQFKDINMRSPKQLKALLYEHLKLAEISTPTDADTLNTLPIHPVVAPLLRYRKVQKLVSTYVKPAKEKTAKDGRIHTTFKIHGTTTGRLSSNKPNLQNIPRDKRIRTQFAAKPGYVIVDCDLSQAELRVLACLSNDKQMIDIFSQGRSIHDEMAIKLFGVGFNKEQKMIAKNVNFGIIYGITEYGLSDQINVNAKSQGSSLQVTLKEASDWINGWYELFPEAADFIRKCRAIPTLRSSLVSPFGRKRRFTSCGIEKMYALQNEAANFPEQSTAHDITLISGIRTIDILDKQYDAKIVNEVHDCLLIETPDNMKTILEVAKLVTDTMKQVPLDYGLTQVPFESEPDVSYRWGEGKTLDLTLYANRENLNNLTFKEWSQK